jgi:hypothetical protein
VADELAGLVSLWRHGRVIVKASTSTFEQKCNSGDSNKCNSMGMGAHHCEQLAECLGTGLRNGKCWCHHGVMDEILRGGVLPS